MTKAALVKEIGELIKDWRDNFGMKPSCDTINEIPKDRAELVWRLIEEEYEEEFKDALKTRNSVEVVDGIGDTLWVVFFALLEAENGLDCVVDHVHKKWKDDHTWVKSCKDMAPDLAIASLDAHYSYAKEKFWTAKEKWSGEFKREYPLMVLADMVITAMASLQLNPLEVIKIIYESNMSKLVQEKDFGKVEMEYREKDIAVYFSRAKKPNYYVIHRTIDDKILKPSWFKKPDLAKIAKKAEQYWPQ